MNEAQRVGTLRVIKKLSPSSRGAIKLHEQFGQTLMCVRHRVDAGARLRYTSVELLVSKVIIKPRAQKLVGVRIDWQEQSLQQVVKAAGAVWDGKAKVWRLPKRLVGILRLADRMVSP